MRIFLTGGTGFIGCHFINLAHSCGIEIVALRRPGSHSRLPLLKQPIWVDGHLDGDLTEHLLGIEVLVHLASHTPNPPYDVLSRCLYWNVYASIRLAEQARQCGVDKFIVAGSCFEYGDSAGRYEKIPVDAPLLPNLSYPISKAAASEAFIGFATENQVKLTILRLFQVFGDGEQESRFWPSLKHAALSGKDFSMSLGEQVRDFIHVSDVAKEFIKALSFENAKPGNAMVKNIGSGTALTLREFAEIWWREWGASGSLRFGEVPYRKNEVMRLVPEISNFKKDESS
ncbi:NAD(P)-dependent oxidoreductase [Polynucleobacter sp. MG-27-Goln-C1]|uniref:NAD-dependent epimerase/dehydratase family protein n=1 Tax=Polynucleobacter sp. MG-27-Goln-C1 TaxID=1819726 RepID=UPI001C0E6BD0|nr:NAD(P)-dependent oxidoreductase [Polynucleobacter sp. MG-27-Goln-C1]MBU3612854.1 NAD(P)-dependent oxidoreductase [Polynucleobacter sp. MG-27-Goln-C1]